MTIQKPDTLNSNAAKHWAQAAAAIERLQNQGLLKRAIITHGLFIRSDNPYEQLQEIIRRLNLQHYAVPLSRCVSCNGRLVPVKKEKVKNLVPSKTYRYTEDFVQCDNCGQVFWKGAHWQRIQKIVKQVHKYDQ